MAEYTPLIQQYWDIKASHRDAILFFRCGDFYEMFYEDAQIAAEELELVLTARGKDANGPIPLAGIPYHAYRSYAGKLLKRGYKVAICEQTEDPKLAKGLVQRAVTQILTPGTVLDEWFVDEGSANYLVALVSDGDGWAAAYCDVSAGEAHAVSAYGAGAATRVADEIARVRPTEIIGPAPLAASPVVTGLAESLGLPPGALTFDDAAAAPHRRGAAPFFPDGEPSLALRQEPLVERAAATLAGYVSRMQGEPFAHFRGLVIHDAAAHMGLDGATVRNLELLETMAGAQRRGSLLGVLDRTVTAMGGRLLRYWLLHPLTCVNEIEARLGNVEQLLLAVGPREVLRNELRGVYDVPRLVGRISSGRATGRDLVALRSSLERLPSVAAACREAGVTVMDEGGEAFESLRDLLVRALNDEQPPTVTEGGIVREGFDAELDRYRSLAGDARGWLEEFQAAERERTGIRSLKVRYNRVFGYYLEVTKANLHLVPDDYVRRQTTAGGERFVTEELKAKEKEILTADERSRSLEHEIFCRLRDEVGAWAGRLQETGARLAELDALCSLAEAAERGGYVRPRFVDGGGIKIREGRHPVVEVLGAASGFVPNDVDLDGSARQLVILTGPNMSGKSTYLRQTALIVLMAQMGSFVPAASAELSLVDKIFTRVGAGDDLSRGQSTFMVEMRETAHILANATPRSLVILDEVGRGTSTYDGLSLAWAIVEYLNQVPERKATTLFATHYHELTELADLFSGIVNLSVLVEERGDEVVFRHRIVPGRAERSYGIHVAKLAGFPSRVLDKAHEVLYELERDEQRDLERRRLRTSTRRRRDDEAVQLSLFAVPERSPVLDELRRCEPDRMTPLDALALLAKWRKLV